MIDVGLKKVLKVAVRGGHNKLVPGSNGLINEVTEDRLVKNEVVALLKNIKNVSVLDVTSETSNTINSDLAYGVSKANSWGANTFVSIHFNNAYKTYKGAIGHETLVYGTASARSKAIQKNIVSLGFKDRGVKKRPDLYELRMTNMEAMIVEVCFVEATEDVALYKKVGYKAVAKKIVEGIVGAKVDEAQKPAPSKPAPSKPKETWENYITGEDVKSLQRELNSQFNAGLKVDGYFGDNTIAKLVVVKRGASGNITKIIQKRLTAKKFNVGKAGCDGDFGAGTENAVKEIQKVNKLTIDGIVGTNTWKALYKK